MENKTRFRPYAPNQLLLLPPSMRDWLPEGHLAYFVMDVIGHLDLGVIYGRYDGSKGGQPPFDPAMMTGLLLYAYAVGIASSRKIEAATYDQIPFRVLTADQHPDHDTIAEFRKRHLDTLAGLFVQVLQLCRQTGLVKLGHISLDGTKVKANASKHKAMSYERMEKKAEELEADVKRLLEQAQATDEAEDGLYGKGCRGDELPEDLRFKQKRLARIKEAMAVLEQQAQAEAAVRGQELAQQEQQRKDKGQKRRGKKPKLPTGKPDPRAQRNFTDSDSRIMKDSASKSFEQAYNCQAAVDDTAQIIVAAAVTQESNDKRQVKPMMEAVKVNTDGQKPRKVSVDNGYFSESNLMYLQDEEIDGYVATGQLKHDQMPTPPPRGRIPASATIQERMARKLRTKKGREIYGKRKEIVEPVFGQIKHVRGFRQFLLRGLTNVQGEWTLICLTHNMLKLFRSCSTLMPG
jgi:transposase